MSPDAFDWVGSAPGITPNHRTIPVWLHQTALIKAQVKHFADSNLQNLTSNQQRQLYCSPMQSRLLLSIAR